MWNPKEKLAAWTKPVASWTGLGDVIAAPAHEWKIASAVEWFARRVLHRDSCGCAKRQSRLNSLVPFKPPKLVIGIPHRNDLEGVHETMLGLRSEIIGKSIRWYGRKIPLTDLVQVVIVNQPNDVWETTDAGGRRDRKLIDSAAVTQKLTGWVGAMTAAGLKTTLINQDQPHGTARAKQECANMAAKLGGEWVLIVDSHVIFKAGVIKQLMQWLKRHRNRLSRDLFHGFLLNDHVQPAERVDRLQAATGYACLSAWDDATGLPLIGNDNLWGQWRDPVLYAPMFVSVLPPDDRPAYSQSEWNQPTKFVPCCLPEIRAKIEAIIGNIKLPSDYFNGNQFQSLLSRLWSAKTPDGKPAWDAVKREQVFTGLTALFTDVWPERFEIESSGGWCMLTRVDQAVPSLDHANQQHYFQTLYHPLMRDFGGEETVIQEMRRANGQKCHSLPWLAAWHRFMRTHAVHYGSGWRQSLRNHTIAFRVLRHRLGDRIRDFFEVDSPLDLVAAAYAKLGHSEADIGQVMAAAIAELREFTGSRTRTIGAPTVTVPAAVAQAVAASPATPSAETLEQRYERLCREPSDINEHLPKLKELAGKCQHVTEFGTRTGVSTVALLMGEPKTVVTYDIAKACGCKGLDQLPKPGTELILKHGPEFNTAAMSPIEPTDLLLIDTLHRHAVISEELKRHGPSVKKFIVCHDVVIFGERGDDGGIGILPAIREWLEANRDWKMIHFAVNNNGLAVMAKLPGSIECDWPKFAKTL